MSRALVTVRSLLVQLRERGAIELPAGALITPAAATGSAAARAGKSEPRP